MTQNCNRFKLKNPCKLTLTFLFKFQKPKTTPNNSIILHKKEELKIKCLQLNCILGSNFSGLFIKWHHFLIQKRGHNRSGAQRFSKPVSGVLPGLSSGNMVPCSGVTNALGQNFREPMTIRNPGLNCVLHICFPGKNVYWPFSNISKRVCDSKKVKF